MPGVVDLDLHRREEGEALARKVAERLRCDLELDGGTAARLTLHDREFEDARTAVITALSHLNREWHEYVQLTVVAD